MQESQFSNVLVEVINNELQPEMNKQPELHKVVRVAQSINLIAEALYPEDLERKEFIAQITGIRLSKEHQE